MALQGDTRSSSSATPSNRKVTSGRSRSPATTRTARSTRPSPATASRRLTSVSGAATRRTGWRSRRTARSSRSATPGAGFALSRYNPNGSLDPSFSGDGKQTTNLGGGSGKRRVAIQGDGKIVAVGRLDGDFALARYNPNGSLDPSFSADGRQTTNFGESSTWRTGVALQGEWEDRRCRQAPGETSDSPATTPTGRSTRASPGTVGRRPTSCSGRGDVANDVAIQATARSWRLASPAGAQPASDFALARYNTNGSLDTSFSGDGRKRTSFAASTVRTGWRSRATAGSSRSAPATGSSRWPAIWGADQGAG